MRRLRSALLPVIVLVVGACGSSKTNTQVASVPAPTVSTATAVSTPTLPPTPVTPSPATPTGTTGTPTSTCSGNVYSGLGYQITGSGVNCSTATSVAAAWVKATRNSGQGSQSTVTISVGQHSTQWSCSAIFQGQFGTVSCQSPGSQGVVMFKARKS